MTIDIIALAKEAFLKTHGGIELNPDKFCKAWIECFSGMLEAEIRKEFEVDIAETIRSSDAVCDSYAEENQRLTAQNAKLMETLKHCHEVFVKYEINRIDGDEISDKAISIIMEALTTQPEKEGRNGVFRQTVRL